MKKIKITPITIISLILTASMLTGCGGSASDSIDSVIASGDLAKAREMKKALSEQQSTLASDIAKLDAMIGESKGDQNFPLVTTFNVKSQPFDHYIELQGGVDTKQNVLIYPETAGPLVKVYVQKGQKVSKNQLLATIDDGGMGNQLLQLKTQLALAKTTFERQEKLWKQNIGTEIQYLQAKTNFEAQENAVKQMETVLGKYQIKAPFSGIIDDIIKEQGTIVAPGGPGSEIFRIVNLSDMFIEVDVPESYVGSVTKGREVEIYFPVLGETIQSKVRQTGNFINPNNRSFTIEVPIPNKDDRIKPNLTARVRINDYSKENAILIPQSVISENAKGEQYAYVTSEMGQDNTALANRNIIETGKTQGDYVEVLSGISNGAQIISEGARSVKDGQKVKILKQ